MNFSEQPKPERIPHQPPPPIPPRTTIFSAPLNQHTLRQFFDLTGGSMLYCLSAVFVAYGIVRILGPVLSSGQSWQQAFPCIATLHIYELALLGALILIVSRKVVDDAISLVVLIALYLVGTCMAQGSVADLNIQAGFLAGIAGLLLAGGKLLLMRRLAGMELRIGSLLGLLLLLGSNYLGPVLLARSVSVNPTQEAARRNLWWSVCLVMLIGAALAWIESLRKPVSPEQEAGSVPFLRRPVMVLVFVMLVLAGSGVHQYTMAYAFALERAAGDYVPVLALGCLLAIEVLRRLQLKIDFLWIVEALIACVPLGVMLIAIDGKSVTADWGLSPDLIAYPPVLFAMLGLILAFLALAKQRFILLLVAAAYGFGVILTFGFSPQHPYDLHYHACMRTAAFLVLLCGLVIQRPWVCIGGIFIFCMDLAFSQTFLQFAASQHLSGAGALAGVFGAGCLLVGLLFGPRLHRSARIVSILCLSLFLYDYLPNVVDWRYGIALFGAGLIGWALWRRIRDLSGSILGLPFMARLFILLKQFAFWRFIIFGFLLLILGTVVSLLKRPSHEANKSTDNEPGG